jgi:hypothetical protein
MARFPDMTIGTFEGKEIQYPNWYKVFIMGNTNSQIIKHECLYEGKIAYEMIENHVILAQITVREKRKENDNITDIEVTPIVENVSPLYKRQKITEGEKLWRYMSHQKFEDLIKTNSLYYARIDQFEDSLEGISSFTSLKSIIDDKTKSDEQKQESIRLYNIRMENNRKVSFVSCWHINEKINYTIWDDYGQNSIESIGIQTNYKKFKKEIEKSGFSMLNEPVQYFDEPYFNQNAYWFPIIFKRSKYKQEQEFRSILYVHDFDLKGIKVKINLAEFITKIHIHPNATKEFFKKIRDFLKENNLKIPVSQSRKQKANRQHLL